MTVSSRSILVTPSRFDRLAQYTYILSLPTLATYAIGNAVIKYEEGFIFYPGHGSKYHTCPWATNGPAHHVRSFSYPEAIPAVEGAVHTGDFPASDGPILCMGLGNVSNTIHQNPP